jgi:serine/threonine-protein kinase
MGSVWVATNLVLERKVAIKVLHSNTRSDLAEARLLREARAAAQIGHANIIQVFDFGYVASGEPYIVMELLRGEDLSVRLSRVGRLAAADAVKLLLPVTSALAAGHAKGIVHRDMKPGNVFIAVDDVGNEIPKVVDFGIAKVQTLQHTPKLTMEGRVVGSPEYLSPEQARGEDDLDATTDVWALCITLYEAVTGDLPFHDENYNRLLRHIIEDTPRPITDYAAGDPALWSIIARGLNKHRRARWPSMEELGRALEGWLEQHGVENIPRVRFASVPQSAADFPAHPPAIAQRGDTTDDGEDAEPTLLKVPPPVPGPAPAVSSAKLPMADMMAPNSGMFTNPLIVHHDPSPSRVEAPPVYGNTRTSSPALPKASLRYLQIAAVVLGGLAVGITAVVLIVVMIQGIPPTQDQTAAPEPTPLAAPEPSPEPTPPPTATPGPVETIAPVDSATPPAASAVPSSTAPAIRTPRPPRTRSTHAPPIPTDPNF